MLTVENEIIDKFTETLYRIMKGESPGQIILPEDFPDNEIKQFAGYLNKFLDQYHEFADFMSKFANGDLNQNIRGKMKIVQFSKTLLANLKHLTYKTRRISEGDFSQKVDFIGDFSEAFNKMCAQLKDAFEKIEAQNEELGREKENYKNLALTLEKEKALLGSLIDSIPDYIYYTDIEGKFAGGNRAFSQLVGKPLEELIGTINFKLYPGNIAYYFHGDGKPRGNEEVIEDRDSKQLHLHTMKTVYRGPEGEILGLIGVARDITEAKKAEEQLLLQSAALTSAANSIVLTDRDGIIQWINPAFTELTGYNAAEAIGKNPNILKSDKHSNEFYKNLWDTILSGKIWHGELVNRKKDGSFYEDEMTITPVLNALGNITHFVAIKQNISERKKAEEQLRVAKLVAEEATKAKSDFLANMSHEIRTPMNSVLGFLGLSLEDPAIPEAQLKHLKIAHNSAHALLALINDILDVSKLEVGRLDLEEKPFNLAQLITETFQTLEIKTAEKGLKLEHKIHPHLCGNFIGDPFRLRQIIMNLAGNAIKFTEKGSVSMSVNPGDEENMLHFTVEDTGIGIPADRIDKIFEAFSQADASTTRRFGGTGLGTTISSQLVELMQGKIWAESELGKGSKFHFTARLPATEEKDDTSAAELLAALKSRRCFRILVVDDIAENLTLATIRLQQYGHTVLTAKNGREAVTQYKKGGIDIILMDIQMPEMDGIEATKEIRKLETTSGGHIPIIALTASVMKVELEKYQKEGMDSTAGKPINFPELFTTIENIVPEGVGEVIKDVSDTKESRPEFELPELEGIDEVKGLANWQDPKVYADALLGFAEKYGDVVEKISQLIEKENFVEACKVTHALKGLAGNLAMMELFDIAVKVDAAVNEMKLEQTKELLHPLQDELSKVLGSTEKLKDLQKEEETSKKEFEPLVIKKLLTDILDAIEQSDPFSAEPLFTNLSEFLSEGQLKPIKDSMVQFDFDTAKDETLALARSLNIELEL
ncbi:PAS domain S-box protein [Candidatus Riflebacteria bacterium]